MHAARIAPTVPRPRRRMHCFLGAAVLVLAAGPLSPAIPAAGQAPPCSQALRWEALAREHLARYPEMEIADLYKAIHQATMGSEHAVDRGDAQAWLADELETLGDGPEEPVVDPLGQDGRIARIHLRPFVKRGGNTGDLLEAFVATARGSYADPAAFASAVEAIRDLSERDGLPWPARGVAIYLDARAAEGFPAVHHSAPYLERYRPAYRVVALDLVPPLMPPGATAERSPLQAVRSPPAWSVPR